MHTSTETFDPLPLLLRFAPKARLFDAGEFCDTSLFQQQPGIGSLHLLSRGTIYARQDGMKPIEIKAPSLVLIPRKDAVQVNGINIPETEWMCATLSDFGMPLAALLPDCSVIDLHLAPRLRNVVDWLFEEADRRAYGYMAAIDRLLQTALVMVIRHLFETKTLCGGLLNTMSDPKLRLTLEALHEAPERDWTLDSMAALASLSRSAFAQRFTQVMGMPTLTYLTEWRMTAARDLLIQGKPVKVVASAVGYQSAAAFSRVFIRHVGFSPSEWQRLQQNLG